MRTQLRCLFLFAATVCAQTDRDEAIVKQLNEKLIQLKDIPADQVRKRAEITAGFTDQMFMHYRSTVIQRDFARMLTSALVGKNLSHENLTPITRSIVEALNTAFKCRDTHRELGQSMRFRASATSMYNALRELRVSATEASMVTEGLLNAGSLIVNPPRFFFRHIPPAFPQDLLRKRETQPDL